MENRARAPLCILPCTSKGDSLESTTRVVPGDQDGDDDDEEEQEGEEDRDDRGVGRAVHLLDLLVVDRGRPPRLHLLRR